MPGNKGRLGVTGALVLVFVLTLVYVNYRPAGEVATLDAAVRMLVSSDYDESADFGFHESKEAHSRDGTVRLLGSSDYDESADFNFHESKDEHLLKYEGTKMSKQECSMEGYNRLRYLKEKEAKVPPMLYVNHGLCLDSYFSVRLLCVVTLSSPLQSMVYLVTAYRISIILINSNIFHKFIRK